MAEKSSFVLYDKYQEQVSMLSDEQAGQLFKAVLAYRNNDPYEINDPAVKILLSVIKQQIDIDDKKYQETCEKRKAAGAKGGHTKSINAKQKAEESSNTKQSIVNDSFAKQSQEECSNAKQRLTNLADSDCDCGNECDSDNEKNNTPLLSPQGEIAKEKPTRHKYGQYKNVLLSNDEIDKLKTEYPTDWQARIERLSEYMASTGKSYKSHLATIRAWARKDKERAPTAAKTSTNGQSSGGDVDDLLAQMTKWGWD